MSHLLCRSPAAIGNWHMVEPFIHPGYLLQYSVHLQQCTANKLILTHTNTQSRAQIFLCISISPPTPAPVSRSLSLSHNTSHCFVSVSAEETHTRSVPWPTLISLFPGFPGHSRKTANTSQTRFGLSVPQLIWGFLGMAMKLHTDPIYANSWILFDVCMLAFHEIMVLQ